MRAGAKYSSVVTRATTQLLDQAEELDGGRETDRKAAQQEWHCLEVREKSGEVMHAKWVWRISGKGRTSQAGTFG